MTLTSVVETVLCADCGYRTRNPYWCSECCLHEELDHGVCCDCGEDRTEHMMAAAYDRAKDIRKYGE